MDHAGTLIAVATTVPVIVLWPSDATVAATNKCLVKSNKTRTGGEATKKQ